jgi:hypothetical protein
MKFISKRLSYANVAMTLALVFAMTGGAYAAKKYLITSTKQISPSVLKQLKGAKGPAGVAGAVGPAGPQGSPGAKGDTGAAGEKGKDGAKGDTGATGEKGKDGAQGEKGAKGDTGATGPAGSPWTAGGKLPSGATESGLWSAPPVTDAGGTAFVAISFTLPFETQPEQSSLHVIAAGEETTECPGSFLDPQAAPGQFCAYLRVKNKVSLLGGTLYKSGAILAYSLEDHESVAFGSWAVTGPTPAP